MTTYFKTSSAFLRHRIRPTLRFGATCLPLLLGATVSRAENPWTTSSMGWSKGSSRWSSRETTRGGTSDSLESSAAVQDNSIDPVMLKAGSIAEQRALPHSTMRCWHYVKEALVAAGSVSSYPQSTYAKQAGDELVRSYGFVRLAVQSAAQAPVGAVIVYGGKGPGHVELRTARGFVSDFYHSQPSNLPFIGAFTRVAKPIQTAQVDGAENSDS
jgi:hypothetical protein